VLYGYSRHVWPPPGGWDATNHVTGYWFLDAHADWLPPQDLLEFLDAGDPPVYVGFGSMGNRNPAEAAEITLQALQRAGQRGVLAAGWGGLSPAELPESVYMTSSIPHNWLFPRMAAVVHHGGAGTTAAGLRAGIPSIVVPFMGDQPCWGQRVAALGVGPRPIPRRKLTVEALAAAIGQAIHDSQMRQRARQLGENIRDEHGVANAVAIVRKLLPRGTP
jgi:UDP:flavonoid glycosyltransferase YjiC (YdhE family)